MLHNINIIFKLILNCFIKGKILFLLEENMTLKNIAKNQKKKIDIFNLFYLCKSNLKTKGEEI